MFNLSRNKDLETLGNWNYRLFDNKTSIDDFYTNNQVLTQSSIFTIISTIHMKYRRV
jgi:hypothetical protein